MAEKQSKAANIPTPKYKQLSLADKCKILQRLEAGDLNGKIAKDFRVTHSAVSYIKKKKATIYAQRNILEKQQGNDQKTRITSTETSAFEQAIYRWFCQKRSLGEPISGPLLREKALLYNEKLSGPSDFQASNGWMQKFKKRHGIREISGKGEKLSGNIDASSTFVAEFNKLIEEGDYDLDNVYNADETGLAWTSLPHRTQVARNETQVAGRKILKDRVTVMACGNASGTHRIPLLVIGKSKNPRCLKNFKNLPVNYRGQRNAWIDRTIFTNWYTTIFLPAIKERKSGENERFLLLLDNAPSHPSAEDLDSIDECCKVVFLPPNVTALIQPMNQGVIEATKKYYKKVLLRQLLIAEKVENSDTVTSFLKNWTMLHCCESIAQAWEQLSDATLRNAWKQVLSKDTLNTAVGNVHNDSDVTHLVNRIPGYSNFTDSEARAWLEEDSFQPGWRILNDDELVDLSHPTEDSMEGIFDDAQENDYDDDCDVIQESPAAREVLKGLNTVLQWYRTRWENEPSDFSTLYKMRQLVEDIILDS